MVAAKWITEYKALGSISGDCLAFHSGLHASKEAFCWDLASDFFFLNIMSGLLYVCFVSVCKGLLFSIKYKLGLS